MQGREKFTKKSTSGPGASNAMWALPEDYRQEKWLWDTTRPIYRRKDTLPSIIFKQGFKKDGKGYDDIIKHANVNQGEGSNWIACTINPYAVQTCYGAFVFEIRLRNTPKKAVELNLVQMKGEKAFFQSQQEVCVYVVIEPEEIVAVYVPREKLALSLQTPKPLPLAEPQWDEAEAQKDPESYAEKYEALNAQYLTLVDHWYMETEFVRVDRNTYMSNLKFYEATLPTKEKHDNYKY